MLTKQENQLRMAVARGALHLDRVMPGWAKKVKLSTLDLQSGQVCVLGQLSKVLVQAVDPDAQPEYWECVEFQDGCTWDALRPLAMTHTQAVELGFNLPEVAYRRDEAWGVLNAEWRLQIRARRAPRVVTPAAA